MRLVLDTNVLVSAAISRRSTPGQVLRLGLDQHRLLHSTTSLAELEEVLIRPKVSRYFPDGECENFLKRFLKGSEWVHVVSFIADCRDPDDNHILALALDGKADAIITGDDDLLVLHPWRGIPILSPAQFLAQPV